MLLLAMLPIFFAVAGTVIYIETDKGTIAIETDDPNVRVIVEQNGSEVKILDRENNQEATLNTGTYSIRLGGDAAALELSLPEGEPFSLKRGEEKIVTVRRKPTEVEGPAPLIEEVRFDEHNGYVLALDFTPDGRQLVSGGAEQVFLWDTRNGRLVRGLMGHERDGISVWDAGTGKLRRRFSGEHSSIKCAALSPNGRMLATGHEAVQVQRLRRDDPANSVLR